MSAPAPPAVPQSLDAVTAEWLTGALRAAGVLGAQARVATVERERIGEGVGFVGLLARLRLAYDGGDGPPSLVVKVHSDDAGARALATTFGLYEREARFYGGLADTVPLYTPRCYYAASDASQGLCALLLEDLAETGRMGDQLEPPSQAEAELCVRDLARMHAAFWNSPLLQSNGWLRPPSDFTHVALEVMFPALWPAFLERFGDLLPGALHDALPGLNRHALALIAEMDNGPMTLVHGDYRIDNMFFGGEDAPYRLAVVDWQGVSPSAAFIDLTYFLSCSLETEQRRAGEDALMRLYLHELRAGGVEDMTMDDLRRSYQRMPLAGLALGVISGATLPQTNERAVRLFETIFRRFLATADDLRSVELIDG